MYIYIILIISAFNVKMMISKYIYYS